MWFSLFTAILVLAITFYQGLQGIFTALINCVLTVLSAALAFAVYENIYFALLMQYQPERGRVIALLAVFILTLLALRAIVDSLVGGNIRFPVYADRIGGGLLGFVTAQVIMGMLTIGFQMLPFGPTFLGFTRYVLVDKETKQPIPLEVTNPKTGKTSLVSRASLDWSKIEQARQSVWLKPDEFTVALMSHLSGNALAGQNRFNDIYPDFMGSVHRARVGVCTGSRSTVEPDALRVVAYGSLGPKEFYTFTQTVQSHKSKIVKLERKNELQPDLKRIFIRVSLDEKSCDKDKYHRFTSEQVRLLARDGRDGKVKEYFLAGINDEKYPYRRVEVFPGQGVVRKQEDARDEFDFVFEVPRSPDFEPLFIEYKQNARAEIRPGLAKELVPPVKTSKKTKSKKPAKQSRRPQDRISGLGPARKESRFSDELPFSLTNYQGTNIDVSGGKFRGGQMIAILDNDWQPKEGDRAAIETFDVPPGKQLLQLSVEKLHPKSWLGNIYGGVIDKISDFYLIDTSGHKYMPVGSYAIAKVGGRPTFELVYLDDTARGFARLPKFQRIKPRIHLKGDYTFCFLFHLPSGAEPVELHTGRKDVDLRSLDLVAPE